VAFAVTACAVLAGYNNLVVLRRWYPAVNTAAAAATLAAPVLLHRAANCVAPLASALARTLDR
jgi:hypothetical protein